MTHRKLKKEIMIGVVLLILCVIISSLCFVIPHFFQDKPNEKPLTEEQILVNKGITIKEKTNFIDEANSLLDKGYSPDEINQIYEYMSDQNIEQILANNYVDLSPFYQISNFDFSKIDRYLAYQSANGLEMKDAVTRVNLNLDEPFYQTVETITDPGSITVLVNKSHALPADYVPEDLVNIPSFPSLQIKDDAVDDFEKLLAAAKLDNVYIIPYSTYRSYDYQNRLYTNYLGRDPKEVVDTYSARPGHSEHQTGLALDVRSSSHWDNLTDADYEWMLNNSYKYGFIVRYPKNNSTITGYQEEPWHIRYIGVEHATKVHELGITYDEYYDLYLTKH